MATLKLPSLPKLLFQLHPSSVFFACSEGIFKANMGKGGDGHDGDASACNVVNEGSNDDVFGDNQGNYQRSEPANHIKFNPRVKKSPRSHA